MTNTSRERGYQAASPESNTDYTYGTTVIKIAYTQVILSFTGHSTNLAARNFGIERGVAMIK